jgi:hypothetical protein
VLHTPTCPGGGCARPAGAPRLVKTAVVLCGGQLSTLIVCAFTGACSHCVCLRWCACIHICNACRNRQLGQCMCYRPAAEVKSGLSPGSTWHQKHSNSSIRESLAADPHPTHTKTQQNTTQQHCDNIPRQQTTVGIDAEVMTAPSSPASIASHWHDKQPPPTAMPAPSTPLENAAQLTAPQPT